jgi:hypothetical protein
MRPRAPFSRVWLSVALGAFVSSCSSGDRATAPGDASTPVEPDAAAADPAPDGTASDASEASVGMAVDGGTIRDAGADSGPTSHDAAPPGLDAQSLPDASIGSCSDLPTAGQWQNVTPTGDGTGAQALTLDPFVMGTAWLGTAVAGLFKSVDCGASWSKVSTGANGSQVAMGNIWSMAVDYVDPGVLYVVGSYGAEGLWKSTNGGVDWTQLLPSTTELAQVTNSGNANPPPPFVGSVSIDPTDHLHLVIRTAARRGRSSTPRAAAGRSKRGPTCSTTQRGSTPLCSTASG